MSEKLAVPYRGENVGDRNCCHLHHGIPRGLAQPHAQPWMPPFHKLELTTKEWRIKLREPEILKGSRSQQVSNERAVIQKLQTTSAKSQRC